MNDEPYLVTLSRGYDRKKLRLFLLCRKGKNRFLKANSFIGGQVFADLGYVQGSCDQLYATTQFRGRVTFVEDINKREHTLKVIIESLEKNQRKL
jgi:hypothetical protein